MNADALRDRMKDLQTVIQDAEMSVRGGKMVDMAGLDRTVAMICNQAVSLPTEQARSLQEPMALLIGDLDNLARAIKEYRDDIRTN